MACVGVDPLRELSTQSDAILRTIDLIEVPAVPRIASRVPACDGDDINVQAGFAQAIEDLKAQGFVVGAEKYGFHWVRTLWCGA